MSSVFEESVERHFSFLIHDYGFSITEKTFYPGESISQGIITYTSKPMQAGSNPSQVIVPVVLDRGYIDVEFGSPEMKRANYFGINEVVRAIAPEIDMNFSPDFSKPAKEIIEPQVAKLSNIVAVHCKSFLIGDFSIGDLVIKARKEQMDRILQKSKRTTTK